jgi:hypothetical protein
MVDGVLYMWVRNLNKDGTGSSLAWSKDHAKTWTDWSFPEIGYPVWLNAGRNYEAAEDDYAYMYWPDTPSAYQTADHILLARVPKGQIARRDAYEFFAGPRIVRVQAVVALQRRGQCNGIPKPHRPEMQPPSREDSAVGDEAQGQVSSRVGQAS